MKSVKVVLQALTRYFALWAVMFAIAGFCFPQAFVWILPYISWILGIIMFGMGVLLKPGDFKVLLLKPWLVMLGFCMQFVLMPALAFILVRLFDVPPALAVGVILLGCCPGGTASNVICYLAKGDVALSVCVTGLTNLAAPMVTPTLLLILLGESVEIAFWPMVATIMKVVLFPIVLGMLLAHFQQKRVETFAVAMPAVSVVGIVLLVAAILGQNREALMHMGFLMVVVVMAHNILGLASGYWLARALGLPLHQARTLGIEVGMQNSGLSVVLATRFFDPAAAVAGALFTIWHNVSGALLVGLFQWQDNRKNSKENHAVLH